LPVSQTLGIAGPLGLGVRVPALMISPFSRGGNVVSAVFDHTSQLKLVAERFGVDVPNVSPWRLATVGDLTATLGSTPDTSVPALPRRRADRGGDPRGGGRPMTVKSSYNKLAYAKD
jgi:phospholipase C